jgi:hypothetical protein
MGKAQRRSIINLAMTQHAGNPANLLSTNITYAEEPIEGTEIDNNTVSQCKYCCIVSQSV